MSARYHYKKPFVIRTRQVRYMATPRCCPRCEGCVQEECLDTIKCLNCGYRGYSQEFQGRDEGARYGEQATPDEYGHPLRTRREHGKGHAVLY